jgi:hypothetical protein
MYIHIPENTCFIHLPESNIRHAAKESPDNKKILLGCAISKMATTTLRYLPLWLGGLSDEWGVASFLGKLSF